MKRTLLILSLLALASPLLAGPELDPLKRIAIQEGGRTKPLDSFARDLAKRVQGARAFGLDRIAGLEPTEWVLAMLSFPEKWKDQEILKVTHAGLRDAAKLPRDRDRFSFAELASHQGFRDAMAAVQAKSERGLDLDPVDREVADLYDTLSTVAGVMNGEALRIVPHPDDPKATWSSLAELDRAPVPQAERVRALTLSLVDAYRAGDRPGVATAASALGRRLAELAPSVYPRAKDLAIEVHYNSLKPYRTEALLRS